MANELISISDLFQKRLFRIPDYQRGFAWGHEQLIDFWDDVINLHENRYHYTGLLSIKAITGQQFLSSQEDGWLIEMGYKPFHVVDGQQRLTTISILLFELVQFVENLSENQGKSRGEILLVHETIETIRTQYILRKRPPENFVTTYLFGYETDNPSSNYLKYMVFMEPFGGTVSETYYTKNLKSAKTFFSKNLSDLYDSEGLCGIEKIYKKLTQRLMFNLHEIEDDYDVFVAFETMNNRGKKLTNLELLKNRLIYLTTLFDDQQLDETDQRQLRTDINNTWKEVYYQLGRNQKVSLSDDEFLRAHWITYFQYSRRRGDDYIRFLLNKFSAKNVFEKITVSPPTNGEEPLSDFDQLVDDEFSDEIPEPEILTTSKLSHKEISSYVNSLKETAEPWYYSFFPEQSPVLLDVEKKWIDRLNRIGIGYFRPLVVAMLLTEKKTTTKERVEFLCAVERFIFLAFRVGRFNASYKSSDYNRKSRELLQGQISLNEITDDLTNTINSDMDNLIANFITHTERRFDKGEGFYTWRDLKYFLYEYEYELSVQKNIKKVDWSMFTKVEKDKVTIEHIFPQTPTNWYWRNQFRQFNDEEKKLLTGSLGNLLPLSQSINSSLQNDSFEDKKRPTSRKGRGYVDGSHSEIEVSSNKDWNAQKILERGIKLLEFMSKRWNVPFTEEQKENILHIGFVNDGRIVGAELAKEVAIKPPVNAPKQEDMSRWTEGQRRNFNFWSQFVNYLESKGRTEDIGIRKPTYNGWYDIPLGSRDYHAFFQVKGNDQLVSGLYVVNPEAFIRLLSLKEEIEAVYGSILEWDRSPKHTRAKRIVKTIYVDIRNPQLFTQHFDWLIDRFDDLIRTLATCDSEAFASEKKHENITEITRLVYKAAKRVYEGDIGRLEGVREIVNSTGMNDGTAGDCIQGFLSMMNNERYTRTLTEKTTRFYLENILLDYGEEALRNAVNACRKHAEYYASLGYGSLRYVEKIVDEYTVQ